MMDEFDDIGAFAQGEPARRPGRGVITRQRFPVARLVSRAYRTASEPLQARMLACLLRPLGTLSLAAVASGAFGRFVHRDRATLATSAMDEVARYSSEQVLELARFVHEVNPETLQQLVGLLADNPMGAAALSTSAIVLLYRRMRALVNPLSCLRGLPADQVELNSPSTRSMP
jgi:hypothetical protein